MNFAWNDKYFNNQYFFYFFDKCTPSLVTYTKLWPVKSMHIFIQINTLFTYMIK